MRGQCQGGWCWWRGGCCPTSVLMVTVLLQEAPLCRICCVSISTGIHILGLPKVSWIFGPQVHPLECRFVPFPLPQGPALPSKPSSCIDWHMVCPVMRMQCIDHSENENQSCGLLLEAAGRALWQGLYEQMLAEEWWRRAVRGAEPRCAYVQGNYASKKLHLLFSLQSN